MKRLVQLALGLVIYNSSPALAQGLTAVKPIEGYTCSRLRLTHEQAVDRSFAVPVYADASARSAEVGTASAIVLVRDPPHVSNGFQEILFPNGRAAWIESKWLMPFRTAAFPDATCTPSLMSNGHPGFKIDNG